MKKIDKWFWAHSFDSEDYSGPFETRDLAIADARAYEGGELDVCYVPLGKPHMPDEEFDAEWLIDEHISECFEDTSPLEESWGSFWKMHRGDPRWQELTEALRSAFLEWAEKHELQPWYVIEEEGEKVVLKVKEAGEKG